MHAMHSTQIMVAETASELESYDLIYGNIATFFEVEAIYKITQPTFSEATSNAAHLLNQEYLDLVDLHKEELNGIILERRDLYFT